MNAHSRQNVVMQARKLYRFDADLSGFDGGHGGVDSHVPDVNHFVDGTGSDTLLRLLGHPQEILVQIANLRVGFLWQLQGGSNIIISHIDN